MWKSIFKTATFKQSQVTVTGTIINGILGALFYIYLARTLGPSGFGLFTISITTMVLFADIADFGTNTGLIRFVSKNLNEKSDNAYKILKLSLEIKLITWAISFVLLFSLAPQLATVIFHNEKLILPLRLSALGVGSALFFSFATSTLQAFQKYFLWSLVNILSNALRLCLILILGYYLLLNLQSSLIAYIALPVLSFLITFFLIPSKEIFTRKNEFVLAKKFLKYNLRVAAFTIISTFSSKLDTYLTAALLSSKAVGIYGVANTLVQYVPQLVSALGLVSSPKFASFQNNQEMLVYFKKFQLLVSGLCMLGLFTIPLFSFVIPFIYGIQYQGAVIPFIVLFIAQLIFLFSIPVHHSVIFYFGRPDVFIWVSIGHLLIIGGLGYFMISSFGIIGAAITVLIGTTFNFLYPLIWLLIRLRKSR